jgi:hypothetical protein
MARFQRIAKTRQTAADPQQFAGPEAGSPKVIETCEAMTEEKVRCGEIQS